MKYVTIPDLKPGDLIDLEGDVYADPGGSNISFEFEFCTVAHVERETPDCWRVDTECDGSFGFPPDHTVAVEGHDSNYDAEESPCT